MLAIGAVASGCRKKQPDDAVAAASEQPAAQASEQARDRCRAAIDHAFGKAKLPDPSGVEKLAAILAEACRSDGWSDEQIACLERTNDATALAKCQPTPARQERLRARLAALTSTDAGVSIADAPRADAPPAAASPGPIEARVLGYASDDEFDRGRKEAEDVRRTAAAVAKLRAPMREAVFGAWRDLVAGYATRCAPSWRTHGWHACRSRTA